MRMLIAIAVAMGCVGSAYATEYCEDQESAQDWRAMVEKYPKDVPLQRLHALRIGICEKIERGSLDPQVGALMFEREQLELEQKRGEREGRQRAY